MIKKQKIIKAFTLVEGTGNRQAIPCYKKLIWIYVAVSTLLILSLTTVLFAEEDPVYEKCTSQTENPGPWCYQEEVEKIGDPALCENILKYWPKAIGVHGWCYYRLAIINKDCKLCDRIKAQDIKDTCKLDACK